MEKLLIVSLLCLAVDLIILQLFIGLALPIWCLVNCVKAQDISRKGKIIWGLAIVILWPIGAIIYGSFAARSRRLKIITRFSIIFIIVAAVFVIVFGTNLANKNISSIIEKLNTIEYTEVSAEERGALKSSLTILQGEINLQNFNVPYFRKRFAVYKAINKIAKDGKITKAEYDDWIKMFESREDLDTRKLLMEDMRSKFTN